MCVSMLMCTCAFLVFVCGFVIDYLCSNLYDRMFCLPEFLMFVFMLIYVL